MKRLLLACVLACSQRASYPVFPVEHRGIRQDVYDAWLDAGADTVTTYSLEYLPEKDLAETCGGLSVDGCSRRSNLSVYIKEGLSYRRRLVVLMHEVGHLTRPTRGHLKCMVSPGDDIMCRAGASDGSLPTARDAAFVKGLIDAGEP